MTVPTNMLSRMLVELALLELDLVALPPSMVALAAVRVAAHTVGEGLARLANVDAALKRAGWYDTDTTKASIDRATAKLHALHAANAATFNATPHPSSALTAIFKKYADGVYLAIAYAKPVKRAPPSLTAVASRAVLRVATRGSAARLQSRVLSYFQTNGADEDFGCSVTDAVQALRANGHQVRAIVEELVAEGHLYSTIDEEHFKATV